MKLKWRHAALILPVAAIFATPASSAASAPRTVTAWISTYDWWNNSPPGYGIEYPRNEGYPTVHSWACCRNGGTYSNPITFASSSTELAPGTRIYIPYFHRYFIKEDLCAGCFTRTWMFDLWVGGVTYAQNQSASPTDIVNMWHQETVIINPPQGEPVSTSLFAYFKI